jgi:cell division protein FtsW
VKSLKGDELKLSVCRFDGYSLVLQGLVLALMGLGLVMIYSAQGRVDQLPMHDAFFSTPAGKQMMFAGISLVVMVIFSWVNYDWLRPEGNTVGSLGFCLLVLSVVLLGLVYAPGVGMEINGARRWLKLGPVTFQPSEFAKIAMVIFLAGVMCQEEYPRKKFFRGLMPLCVVIGVVCGLIAKEDLGTAAVIAGVSGLLLVAAGFKLWHLFILSVPAILGFAYFVIMEPYRILRITTFLNPEADPRGAGYHAIQSLIAIGDGGWFGMGLGEGLQKYGYLPEDTTDFIYSIICEELGAAGGMAVLGVFAVMAIVGWLIYRYVEDGFGRLLVIGLLGTIGLQAAINVAVATVSMPTKGIALPFVSAGGSGLVFAAMAVGIVCSANRYSEWNLE